jgi:CRISPR-associated endonuclease Csn1
MADNEIPEGLYRQTITRNTIYSQSKRNTLEVSRNVTATIGSVTDKLREDWELLR